MTKHIRKAIIPAAGLGTRFLPATKAQPKEMLPLLNKPTIQYIVEEAVASGIDDILIVTGRGKRAIEDHFDSAFELEVTLEHRGKFHLLHEVRSTNHMAHIHYIRQSEPLGLGHAIACARNFIGNEPFAVLLGDDVILHPKPCLQQMIDIYEEQQKSVIAIQAVDLESVSRYGVIKPNQSNNGIHQIEHLVEKPRPELAPSNLAIIGRYILKPTIFDILDSVQPGAGGEVQLTDALAIFNQLEPMIGYEIQGDRFDVGEVAGFVKANLELALRDPTLQKEMWTYLQTLLQGATPYEQHA